MNCLVIFGATGDLTSRKLLPALWNGFLTGRIKPMKIIGVARREWDNEVFKKVALEACKPKSEKWKEFEENIFYHKADFMQDSSYPSLKESLENYDDILYFLATPPEAFPIIARNISGVKNNGFRRLMVEKPFGKDLKTAEKLNGEVKKYFGNEVYRIDHYLGKGLVRNILTLRFSNEVFKAVWNNKHISHVEIIHSETLGVETRSAYYDSTGIVKDMLQSHLLQMLALIAMEKPRDSKSSSVLMKKAEIIEKLKPPNASDVIMGQYEGYEKDVGHPSNTETFVALKLFLKQANWNNVPFYLLAGKKRDGNYAKIVVVFKKANFEEDETPNKLTITIQPEEHITFRFNLRHHEDSSIRPFEMDYCESCEFGMSTPQAYEKLVIDALNGDKSLFASWAEIMASWKFADKLLKIVKKAPRHKYAQGSKGPALALEKELIHTD